jgi:hypothetical protein
MCGSTKTTNQRASFARVRPWLTMFVCHGSRCRLFYFNHPIGALLRYFRTRLRNIGRMAHRSFRTGCRAGAMGGANEPLNARCFLLREPRQRVNQVLTMYILGRLRVHRGEIRYGNIVAASNPRSGIRNLECRGPDSRPSRAALACRRARNFGANECGNSRFTTAHGG